MTLIKACGIRAPKEVLGGMSGNAQKLALRVTEHLTWRTNDWKDSHQFALPLLCRLTCIKPRNIRTRTFLIPAHGLIFPKSVMMSESLRHAFLTAPQTGVKVPQLQGYRSGRQCAHSGSQESGACLYLWLV